MAWYDVILTKLGIQPATRDLIYVVATNLDERIQAVEDGAPVQIIGALDCSTNPNYPEALAGHKWLVSVAGKIGGGSGLAVEAGDWIVCIADSDGGTQAAVGDEFSVVQANVINGVVQSAASVADNAIARYDGETGKIVQASLATITDGGTINLPEGELLKINDVDVLAAKVDKEAGKALSTNDFTDEFEGMMNAMKTSDINIVVSPLTVNIEVGDTAAGWHRDVEIKLTELDGVTVHTWFNGRLPIALTYTTNGNGISEFDVGSPVADNFVSFTAGVATVRVNSSLTWAENDTNTITVSGPLPGGFSIVGSANQSVETVIADV